jgi:hypothetical protein
MPLGGVLKWIILANRFNQYKGGTPKVSTNHIISPVLEDSS